MATHTFVNIDIPEAIDLADLTGILFDLNSSRRFAIELKEMLERKPPDYSLVEPLTTAIIVRYSRPFTTGVRRRIEETELNTLSREQRVTHDGFRFWRDKHIAHSVNAFEENQPVARYCVERFDDDGFTSVECIPSQVIGMSLHDVETIIELATHFIETLEARLKSEKEKVLEIVRSLPREQVLSMAKPTRRKSIQHVGKKRKR